MRMILSDRDQMRLRRRPGPGLPAQEDGKCGEKARMGRKRNETERVGRSV